MIQLILLSVLSFLATAIVTATDVPPCTPGAIPYNLSLEEKVILQHEHQLFKNHGVHCPLFTYLINDVANFNELTILREKIQKTFPEQAGQIYFPTVACTPAFENEWGNFILRPLVAPPAGRYIEGLVQSILTGALMYRQVAIEKTNHEETLLIFRIPTTLFELRPGTPALPLYLCGAVGHDQNSNPAIIFHCDAQQKGIFADAVGPRRPAGTTICSHGLFAGASKTLRRTSDFDAHVNEEARVRRVANAAGKSATDLLSYSQELARQNPRAVLPSNYIRDGQDLEAQYCLPLYEEGAAPLEPQAFCTLKARHPPLLTTALSPWQTFCQMLSNCPYRQRQFATLVTEPWGQFCTKYPYAAPVAATPAPEEAVAKTPEETEEELRTRAVLAIYDEAVCYEGYESDEEVDDLLKTLSSQVDAGRGGPFSLSDAEVLKIAARYDITGEETEYLKRREALRKPKPREEKLKKIPRKKK